MMRFTKIHFCTFENDFQHDTSVLIPESCVSDNPIRYERPNNGHEYYHGTTRNDPDPATVELRFRPCPQFNTSHPDKFKRFKLVVALCCRGGSQITRIHGTTRTRADVSTVLLRLMSMHLDLINRGES